MVGTEFRIKVAENPDAEGFGHEFILN